MLQEIYDDIFAHIKEDAGLPYFYHELSLQQQYFFRDLWDKLEYTREAKNKELVEDLNLIKTDLEAVIAESKK